MILDSDGYPKVPVHVCWSDSEAEVVIAYLRAHGVEARANSEIPHSILPITADGLGEVSVLVKAEDETAARNLLAAHTREREEGRDGAGP
ncbi:MAG: hypothetical protein ACLFTT_03760 [Candidatus Hydrogenedentota bacterium]